jgi:hypothetical protein
MRALGLTLAAQEYGQLWLRVGRRGKRERPDGAGCDGGKRVSADAGREAPTHFVRVYYLRLASTESGGLSLATGNCIWREQIGAIYRVLNLNTGQVVAVKRIGLGGLKEEEIVQLIASEHSQIRTDGLGRGHAEHRI